MVVVVMVVVASPLLRLPFFLLVAFELNQQQRARRAKRQREKEAPQDLFTR